MTEVIDLERQANKLVPEGVHEFTIVDSGIGQGNSGAYWRLACEAEGDLGMLTVFLSMSPAARWKLEQFLNAINAPTTGKMHYSELVGKRFRGLVRHEEYEGQKRATVDTFYPVTNGSNTSNTVKKAEPIVIKRTDESVKGLPNEFTQEELPF